MNDPLLPLAVVAVVILVVGSAMGFHASRMRRKYEALEAAERNPAPRN